MTWVNDQKIYVVYDEDARRFRASDNVITRVGRTKGYFVEHGRETSFYLEDGSIDGGQYTSPGKVWHSKNAYETARGIRDAWDYVRQRVPYRAPQDMDLEAVNAIASLLDIAIPHHLAEGAK